MSEKVLVIDDNKELQKAVYDHVEKRGGDGSRIVFVSNGKDGVDKYREILPLCVFIDIKFSFGCGAEVFKKIKEFDPSSRVIIMTGFGSESCAAEIMKYGVDAYICKDCKNYLTMMTDLVVSVMGCS